MAATNFYQPNFGQAPMNPAYMPQQAYMTQTQSPMIWVKGQAQAEGYQMANNATVVLWDSEQDSIYIKTTDVLGKPSMKVLDYKIREMSNTVKEEPPRSDVYATKEDLINFMNNVMNEIRQIKPQPNRKFKED